MHHIDGRFRGANALGAADVNGDGQTDDVTNLEVEPAGRRWDGHGACWSSAW